MHKKKRMKPYDGGLLHIHIWVEKGEETLLLDSLEVFKNFRTYSKLFSLFLIKQSINI